MRRVILRGRGTSDMVPTVTRTLRVIFVGLGCFILSSSVSRGASIHSAAADGDVETVARLLSENPSLVNANHSSGKRPLHWAVFNGHSDVAQLLLTHGADISSQDANGWTPLHLAAQQDNAAILQMLLRYPVAIDKRDGNGWTALDWAASWGITNAVASLLSAGADPNIRDELRHGALYLTLSALRREASKLLIYRRAEVQTQNIEAWALEHNCGWDRYAQTVRWLLDRGSRVNAPDADGNTPLHVAVGTHCTVIIELLLEHGADVNARNKRRESPLWDAAQDGNANGARLLLQHRADVEIKDAVEATPLHTAAKWNRVDVIRVLIEGGANVNARDGWGKTPLQWAEFSHSSDAAEVLRQNGGGL